MLARRRPEIAEVRDRAVIGTVLGLIAGLGYGVYMFLTRRGTRRKAEGTLQPLAWATASAAVTSAIIAQFTGGLQLTGISPKSWMYLIALALLGQVVAWLLINRGSARLVPTMTASLLLIQPVLALVLAALVLGEKLTAGQAFGAGLVVLAVAVANGLWRARWKHRTARSLGPDFTAPGSGPR